MRRKQLVALLGAGIMAVNLIAPGSISVVQASEVRAEQTEDAGQSTDAEESEEAVEELVEEETDAEKSELEETGDVAEQAGINDSADSSVDTQAEKDVVVSQGIWFFRII